MFVISFSFLYHFVIDYCRESIYIFANIVYCFGIAAAAVAAAAAKLRQSCLTLCDCIDGSPPGSPAPGILQARTLEWVAISFSSA